MFDDALALAEACKLLLIADLRGPINCLYASRLGMSIRNQARTILSEEVAERVLALPTPPHHSLSIAHHHFLSSAAGAARQVGPTTAEADLYGFTDMLGRSGPVSRELALLRAQSTGMVTNDSPSTDASAFLIEVEARLSRALGHYVVGCLVDQQTRGRRQLISELWKADYRRQRQLAETLKIRYKEPQGADDRATETAGTAKGPCRARAHQRRPGSSS
ncbi:hypothetical protein Tco_0941630 [Tanacetum coccineum]|uniref:Uncharacterized protein n=1 Tax=Tanacetum coccineum TaxID=301880 RepID=A0ABQ5DRG5_9ASTR